MTDRPAEDLRQLFPGLVGASGGFTMLANDQRESLRAIIASGRPVESVDGGRVREFKRAVVRILSPYASAVLLDREFGITETTESDIADGCGLILAADILHQVPGGPVTGSSLDPEVTVEFIHRSGAAAIKLLVIWRDGADHTAEEALIAEFAALAKRAGVASLVEGIARPATGDTWSDPAERNRAILRAAEEIGRLELDIYKAEVPGYRPGDVSGVRVAAEKLTEVVPCPWVVLSNGVAPDDFVDAVREAVAGGADGFLAGRAVWVDAAATEDPASVLSTSGVRKLIELESIVAEGRR